MRFVRAPYKPADLNTEPLRGDGLVKDCDMGEVGTTANTAVEHQWGTKTTCQFLYFSQISYLSKSLEDFSGFLTHFSGCVGAGLTISL